MSRKINLSGKKPALSVVANDGHREQQMLLIHAQSIHASIEEVDSLISITTAALRKQDCDLDSDAARVLDIVWERLSAANGHAATLMAMLGDTSAQEGA